MTRAEKLAQYRDALCSIFAQNMLTISQDRQWGPREQAGTAIVVLSSAIGGAAGMWAEAHPHLKNAPIEAVIEDMMGVVNGVLTERKGPKLHVVKGGDA